MLNLPMAQSSTGVEYRAASAIDIALWDLFGKVCNQPVHQMLGGLCRDKQRIYNTCAGTQYVRSTNISPVANWDLGAAKVPTKTSTASCTAPTRLPKTCWRAASPR